MKELTSFDIVRLFQDWEAVFNQQREFLIALDSKVGDSDLGITMSRAFSAAAAAVRSEGENADLAKLLRIAGATIARNAPSTMGTLAATGFLRAGKVLEDTSALDASGAAMFWKAFRDGVAERGKAKVGDKTVLDVLDPAAVALEAAAREGASLADALGRAAAAAASALEATKRLVAQHGKAAAFRDKTVGLQDAGATVGVLLIECMARVAAV